MPLGSPVSCLSPSLETTGGLASLCGLAALFVSALCPTATASQRTISLSLFLQSLLTSLAPLPAWHKAQLKWLQALGHRLESLRSPGSGRRAGRQALCSFTHCPLPSPQGRGACFIRQQTYQGLCGCQALAGTPTQSSSVPVGLTLASEALRKEPTTLPSPLQF